MQWIKPEKLSRKLDEEEVTSAIYLKILETVRPGLCYYTLWNGIFLERTSVHY